MLAIFNAAARRDLKASYESIPRSSRAAAARTYGVLWLAMATITGDCCNVRVAASWSCARSTLTEDIVEAVDGLGPWAWLSFCDLMGVSYTYGEVQS